MKLILVNRFFHPDQSATSRMVSSLAFSLVRRGVPVTALASRSFQDGGPSLPAREYVQGVEVHRLSSSGFGRRKLVGRAADYATFQLSAAAWLLTNARRGDICVVCTDPPLLSVVSALPAALRGARLVNWVMDLFPETAMELGVMKSSGMPGRISMRLRDWSLRMSASTICPMEAMTSYLKQHHTDAGNFTTVRHWADGAEIFPVAPEENALRREWGLQDAFVVGYSGNFGRAHEFGTLLSAAELLRDRPGLRFLMIGDGQQRDAVVGEARRRGLTNMIFKPYQPSARLAESLSTADVHLVSLLPRLEHCIVPSKFYGVLAAGRPTIFIGDHGGEVASVLREAGCGETVAPGKGELLAAQIARMQNSPDECILMGKNARRLFETEYTRETGVARWSEALGHLFPHDAPFPATVTREATT